MKILYKVCYKGATSLKTEIFELDNDAIIVKFRYLAQTS